MCARRGKSRHPPLLMRSVQTNRHKGQAEDGPLRGAGEEGMRKRRQGGRLKGVKRGRGKRRSNRVGKWRRKSASGTEKCFGDKRRE